MSKSKVWASILLGIQVVNAIAAALTYVSALDLPAGAKDTVLATNLCIAAVVGGFQAFARALGDADGDGVPDVFDDSPHGERSLSRLPHEDHAP